MHCYCPGFSSSCVYRDTSSPKPSSSCRKKPRSCPAAAPAPFTAQAGRAPEGTKSTPASPRGTVGFPGNFHKAEWYLLKTKAFCRKSQPQTMNTQAVHPGGQVPSPCWVDSPDNRSWPSSFLSAHLTSQSPPSRNRD